MDSANLYKVLTEEVIPLLLSARRAGHPAAVDSKNPAGAWSRWCRNSAPARMVREYTQKYYLTKGGKLTVTSPDVKSQTAEELEAQFRRGASRPTVLRNCWNGFTSIA